MEALATLENQVSMGGEKENLALKLAKEQNIKYVPTTFKNDDTPKQLQARARYIIAKKQDQ